MHLLTGLQFDICYIIQRRVGFKIAEMARFLKYISSYYFALKIVNPKILQNSLEYIYSYLFIKLLNTKLLMSNFSAEIFIFKYFEHWFNTVLNQQLTAAFKGGDIQNFWEARRILYGGLTILWGDLITP